MAFATGKKSLLPQPDEPTRRRAFYLAVHDRVFSGCFLREHEPVQ
jgi:hypothetical protein